MQTLDRWREDAQSRRPRPRASLDCGRPVRSVLHGNNGATLKATTVLAMLQWLGVKPSHSHPRASDDSPYAEALFRTTKYRPEFQDRGFTDLNAAH